MQLQDRVAIVTGAGGGLGKAHAELLAGLGAKLLVNDMNDEAAERVAAGFGRRVRKRSPSRHP